MVAPKSTICYTDDNVVRAAALTPVNGGARCWACTGGSIMNHWIHWRSKLAPTVSCRRGAVFLGLLSAVLAVPACGSSSGAVSTTTLTFATVDNPDQNNLVKLIPEFYKTHPDIKIKTIQLQQNDLRPQEAEEIATHGGRYDVLTTGTDNTPIWAKNGWLVDLSADIQKTSSYDAA